ncbi:sulfatase [Persicobacter diffluens]|uniref:N-sulphoglucosamine sulphohydrolase C-terminal domain-containing protein n=1 Tax=Persicobacter diffluens TaxID=981 RepID=A0AAN4W380_9BACT|nr:hypothetical protein PEDI_39740 [Persicobacter diffluens]
MNRIYVSLGLLLGMFFSIGAQAAKEKNKDRPNVVFIMSDDHANRAISAYGSKINTTPNIDRIADEGAIFQQNFVGNSICSPSRATLFTGKHSHKNGIMKNNSFWNGNQTLLPKEFKKAGYQTALVGKWHLRGLPGNEFDYFKILRGAGHQGFYYNPDFLTKGDKDVKQVNGYVTDLVVDEALRWLEEDKKEENPFMLFVKFKAPHVPRLPHFRYLERYVNDTIPEPDNLFDDYQNREIYASKANMKISPAKINKPYGQCDHDKNIYFQRMTDEEHRKWHDLRKEEDEAYQKVFRNLGPKEKKAYAYQRFMKDYLRCVDGIDDNIGRLLDYLDQEGLSENTIVVYCGDQSYFLGEHGFAEKRFMYEEAMQQPMVMRWPKGIKAKTSVESLTQNIDIAPTLLDLANIKVPKDMQGASWKPLLAGKTPADWRTSLYYHYYDHGKHGVPRHEGVRTERYKLVSFYTDGKYELYDLDKDPMEMYSVYNDPKYKEVVAEMKTELLRLRKFYGVPDAYLQAPYKLPK